MQPAFLTDLEVKLIYVSWWKSRWELVSPLRYRTCVFGNIPKVIEVPVGFRMDFASVPRIPIAYWLTKGVMRRASVLHDYIYRTKICSRSTGDLIFNEAGTVTNAPAFLRIGMYFCVRAFGWINY